MNNTITTQALLAYNPEKLSLEFITNNLPIAVTMETATSIDQLLTIFLTEPNKYLALICNTIDEVATLKLLKQLSSQISTKIVPIIVKCQHELTNLAIKDLLVAGAHYYIQADYNATLISTIINSAISDRLRYLEISNDLTAEKSIANLEYAEFKFQHLAACQSLASYFANACPNPRLAVIGILEILVNAIEHGNLGISYLEKTKLQASDQWLEEVSRRIALPENHNKFAKVIFKRTAEHIILNIVDQGAGFQWDQFEALDASRLTDNHGRGIMMAKNLAFERLEYLNKGNEVNCYIKL